MDDDDEIPCVLADDVEGVREELGEDGPFVMGGHVKYPPQWWDEHAPPALVVADYHLPKEHHLLHVKDAEWQSTGNPVAAVESIIMRHRAGVFPSVKVMEWLAQGFEEWHNHQGKKSLEQCLGLKKPSGHAANQMKEAARQAAIQHLMKLMLHLRCAFGLKITDAASILAAWTEDPGCYTGDHEFKLSEGELQKHWKAAKWARDEWLVEKIKKRYQDDEQKRELIEKFPHHIWSHLLKLKPYL